MKKIYILDENISSQKNGIGTFIRELFFCLTLPISDLCLILFNSDVAEFNIIEEKGVKKILFPVLKGSFLLNMQVVDKFFRLYIKDDINNIFFVNHSPCVELLESLKTYFPLSKVVFIIHDFNWTLPLMGDLLNYKSIRARVETDNVERNKLESFIFNVSKKERQMYELADRVVCLSKDSYNILRCDYGVDEDKLSLIPNGIRDIRGLHLSNRNEIKSMFHFSNEDKILLCVGRPTLQKGVFDLILAMDIILKYNRNAKLVIVGDGNESSMKELVKVASKNAASIIFVGQVDKVSLRKWYTIADIGVVPSYYEQCSYTGIEMMMFGLPIVASDGLGVRNMFVDGINAKIARIGNRKKPTVFRNNLAGAIIELLDSPELCDELGKEAKKTYKSIYSIRQMKKNYKKLVELL